MKRFFAILLLLNITATIYADGIDFVALVIGNANYNHNDGLDLLKTPLNDANGMACKLKSFGVELTNDRAILNANKESMDNAIDQFAKDSKKDSVKYILFYYSGHGAEVEGETLLLPVHEKIAENNLLTKAVKLNNIIQQLNIMNPSAKKIIILDACRINHYNSGPSNNNGYNDGLPQRKNYANQGDVVIFYASGYGMEAKQGSTEYSIFTEAWLDNWKSLGDNINTVFSDVKQQVKDKTDGSQFPDQKGSFDGIIRTDSTNETIVENPKQLILSIGYHYPTSYDIRIGVSFGNWFADLGVGTPFKKTSKIDVMNSSGKLITTQSYNMYDVKTRCGYMWNLNKWHYGVYAGYSWAVIKGNYPKLSAGGANIHSFDPGVQLEYTLAKRIALFANIEGKLAFSKEPSANYNEIKACCPEVNDWTKPFGIGIGLKFNFTKK